MEFLAQILQGHTIIAPLAFMVVRSSSVIIPPIPGLAFDIVGIIAFGPVLGFVYAELGIMLGASVVFWIARKFREPAVKRFVSLQKLHHWEGKLSEKQKFWGLVGLRLPTNAFFDYISYAAGLSTASFKKFFVTTLIGSAPNMVLVYWFGGILSEKGIYYTLGAFLVALIIFLLFFRRRSIIR